MVPGPRLEPIWRGAEGTEQCLLPPLLIGTEQRHAFFLRGEAVGMISLSRPTRSQGRDNAPTGWDLRLGLNFQHCTRLQHAPAHEWNRQRRGAPPPWHDVQAGSHIALKNGDAIRLTRSSLHSS